MVAEHNLTSFFFLFAYGMASTTSLSVLIIGHSYVGRLSDFCKERDISNFGFPDHFCADALPGATLVDLSAILPSIIAHVPNIIIFYFGSFDLLIFLLLQHCFLLGLSCVSFLFLLLRILDIFLVIFLLEQHFWLSVPLPRISTSLLNRRLATWNALWLRWSSCASFFAFFTLLSLNWASWLAELVQGHLLSNAVGA